MEIEIKIYSCYKKTYEPICKHIIQLLYNEQVNIDDVKITLIDTSENNTKNIQSQRRVSKNSIYKGRMIRIFEDSILRHIIGISNTNFEYLFKTRDKSNIQILF